MLIQHLAKVGEGSGQPTKPQHTPTTASPSQPKRPKKHRKTKRNATKISQFSGPTTLVADETVHEERRNKMEMAATTASSLEAEQDSGIINRTQSTEIPNEPIPHGIGSCGRPRRQDTILGDTPAQTRFERLSKQFHEPPLSRVNTLRSGDDRIQKLKKESAAPQFKKRLFKVRIESSAEKSLGDQKDASNQGRNDQDEEISFVQEDAESQERYDHDIKVNTASTSITTASINLTATEPVTTISAPVTTIGVSISTAEPSTLQTTTTLIEDKDLIIAQTLIKMRNVKLKEKLKEKGVSSTILTRGVIMKEASVTASRPIVPPQRQLDPKDKGKDIMQEPERPVKVKGKDQIALDEEVTRRLEAQMQAKFKEEERVARQRKEDANLISWDNTQAMMEADYELAQRLQAEEQGELTIKERSKLFVELMDKRKKHFVKLRVEEIRRKPPTKAQKRNQMYTYLKNMANYKHNSEVLEGSEKKAKSSGKEVVSKKRTEKEFNQKSSKRQKTSESSELAKEPRDKEVDELLQEELQQMMIIVLLQGMNVEAYKLKKEYPLSKGTLTLMLVAKLLVDQDNEMSRELLRKILMIVGFKRLLSVVEVTDADMEVTTAETAQTTTTASYYGWVTGNNHCCHEVIGLLRMMLHVNTKVSLDITTLGNMAPSESQALLFDMHYDGVFFFLPLRLQSHEKKDPGNMSYEELLGWAGEEIETMYSPSIKSTSPMVVYKMNMDNLLMIVEAIKHVKIGKYFNANSDDDCESEYSDKSVDFLSRVQSLSTYNKLSFLEGHNMSSSTNLVVLIPPKEQAQKGRLKKNKGNASVGLEENVREGSTGSFRGGAVRGDADKGGSLRGGTVRGGLVRAQQTVNNDANNDIPQIVGGVDTVRESCDGLAVKVGVSVEGVEAVGVFGGGEVGIGIVKVNLEVSGGEFREVSGVGVSCVMDGEEDEVAGVFGYVAGAIVDALPFVGECLDKRKASMYEDDKSTNLVVEDLHMCVIAVDEDDNISKLA
nr:hypothetical protein [Tanacetum cinerariifolium]